MRNVAIGSRKWLLRFTDWLAAGYGSPPRLFAEGKIGDVGLTSAEWTLRVIASAWAASTVDMPPSQSR